MLETQKMWVQYLSREDFLGGGNGNPLQCSCLKSPMNRGLWWATVHSVTEESDVTKRL